MLVFVFIIDMITWPIALINSSKIILVEELGEENV